MSVTGARLLVFVSWGDLHTRLMLKVTHSVIKTEWQAQELLRADTVNSFPLPGGLRFCESAAHCRNCR